jgi:hypothetical protein
METDAICAKDLVGWGLDNFLNGPLQLFPLPAHGRPPLRRSRIALNLTAEREGPGREGLFDRERESDPDLLLWDDCVRACEDVAV